MNFFVKEIKKVDRYGTERIVREIRKGRIGGAQSDFLMNFSID